MKAIACAICVDNIFDLKRRQAVGVRLITNNHSLLSQRDTDDASTEAAHDCELGIDVVWLVWREASAAPKVSRILAYCTAIS